MWAIKVLFEKIKSLGNIRIMHLHQMIAIRQLKMRMIRFDFSIFYTIIFLSKMNVHIFLELLQIWISVIFVFEPVKWHVKDFVKINSISHICILCFRFKNIIVIVLIKHHQFELKECIDEYNDVKKN